MFEDFGFWESNRVPMLLAISTMSIKKYVFCGGGIGLVLLGMAVFLAGAGHGTDFPFLLFFSPLMLVFPFVAVLCGPVLYVGYALLIRWGNRRNKGAKTLAFLALVHFGSLGIVACVWLDKWETEYLQKSFREAPIVTAFFFTPFLFAILLGVYTALKPHDPQDGVPRCRTCSYNLTGNISGICPECGEQVNPDERFSAE